MCGAPRQSLRTAVPLPNPLPTWGEGIRTALLADDLLSAGFQHLAGEVSRMMAVIVEDVAVYDRVLDALRRHHESAAAAGQIVLHARALGRADFALVENRDVGGKPDLEPSAILYSEKVCRLRRDSLDRTLQRQRLALAHPRAEQ